MSEEQTEKGLRFLWLSPTVSNVFPTALSFIFLYQYWPPFLILAFWLLLLNHQEPAYLFLDSCMHPGLCLRFSVSWPFSWIPAGLPLFRIPTSRPHFLFLLLDLFLEIQHPNFFRWGSGNLTPFWCCSFSETHSRLHQPKLTQILSGQGVKGSVTKGSCLVPTHGYALGGTRHQPDMLRLLLVHK